MISRLAYPLEIREIGNLEIEAAVILRCIVRDVYCESSACSGYEGGFGWIGSQRSALVDVSYTCKHDEWVGQIPIGWYRDGIDSRVVSGDLKGTAIESLTRYSRSR